MMVGCQYLPKYMATQLTGSFKLGRIKFEGVVDKLLILLLRQFKPLRLDRKHCFIEKLEYRFICFGVLDLVSVLIGPSNKCLATATCDM